MKNKYQFYSFLLFLVSVLNSINVSAQCGNLGINSTMVDGNQPWTGRLGSFFTVNNAITITELGVFDSGQNGISGSITVGIIKVSDASIVVPPVVVSGSDGYLSNAFRMIDVPDVVLPAGSQYAIVAVGFSNSEKNGNAGVSGGTGTGLNTGTSDITYNGEKFSAATTFGLPTSNDGGPIGRYHAGTFRFTTSLPNAPTITTTTFCNGTNMLTASNYAGSLLWNTNETTASINVNTPSTYTVTQTVGSCISPAAIVVLNSISNSNIRRDGQCYPLIADAINASSSVLLIEVLDEVSSESFTLPPNHTLTFANGVNYTIDAGHTIINNGTIVLANGSNLINHGKLKGSGSVVGSLSNSGTVLPGN